MPSLFDQDSNKNYLEELVGEGKKFKTVEELARGKFEADQTVAQRNQVIDQMREDYLRLQEAAQSRQNDELLSRLEARLDALNSVPAATPPKAPERISAPELDKTLFNKLADEREAQRKADANFAQVETKLKETFGENYQKSLQERMNFYGLSAEDVDSLARRSPTAFYSTFGLNQSAQSLTNAPRSSVNTTAFSSPREEKHTWSYWQNIRKTDPKKYYDPKSINQRHDDAVALGADFQDGDFNG